MQYKTYASCLATVAETDTGEATDIVGVIAPLACDEEIVTLPLTWDLRSITAPLGWDVDVDGVTLPLHCNVCSVLAPLVSQVTSDSDPLDKACCVSVVLSLSADTVTLLLTFADTCVSALLRSVTGNSPPDDVTLRVSGGRLTVEDGLQFTALRLHYWTDLHKYSNNCTNDWYKKYVSKTNRSWTLCP